MCMEFTRFMSSHDKRKENLLSPCFLKRSQMHPNALNCNVSKQISPKTSDQTNPLSHIHPSTSPRVGHLSSFSTSSLRFKLKAQKLQLLEFQWELWGELVTQDMECPTSIWNHSRKTWTSPRMPPSILKHLAVS